MAVWPRHLYCDAVTTAVVMLAIIFPPPGHLFCRRAPVRSHRVAWQTTSVTIVTLPVSSLSIARSIRETARHNTPPTGDPAPEPLGVAAVAGRDELLANLRAAIADIESLPETSGTIDAPRERALASLRAADRGHRAFCRAAAHDLRNPLSAIRGQSQLLTRRLRREADAGVPPDVDRLSGGLTAIDDAVSRLTVLIVDLLECSSDGKCSHGEASHDVTAGPGRPGA